MDFELTSGRCGENVFYEFDNETGVLKISGSGNMFNYEDEDLFEETEDAENDVDVEEDVLFSDFAKNDDIKAIIVEEGVTGIGDNAFYQCKNLDTLVLPDSIERIGAFAFEFCESLEDFVFPANLKTIDDFAFSGCEALQYVELYDKLETIGMGAFDMCDSLLRIVLPISIKEIGEMLMHDVDEEFILMYEGDEADWETVDIDLPNNALMNAEMVFNCYDEDDDEFDDDDEFEEDEIIEGYCGLCVKYEYNVTKGILDISGSGKMYDYDDEKASPFRNDENIKLVLVSGGITGIGSRAFEGCSNINLFVITEETPLESIGSYAFYGCSSITNIKFPKTLKEIARGVFKKCTELLFVELPDALEVIRACAFEDCTSLVRIAFSSGVKAIEKDVFNNCPELERVIFNGDEAELDAIEFDREGNEAFFKAELKFN